MSQAHRGNRGCLHGRPIGASMRGRDLRRCQVVACDLAMPSHFRPISGFQSPPLFSGGPWGMGFVLSQASLPSSLPCSIFPPPSHFFLEDRARIRPLLSEASSSSLRHGHGWGLEGRRGGVLMALGRAWTHFGPSGWISPCSVTSGLGT